MTLYIVPCDLRTANAFVAAHHRHHRPVRGHKFSIGVADPLSEASYAQQSPQLAGVIIVSRPVARGNDEGRTLEVTRCCTDGTQNACSKLYAAAWRATRALGYDRLITYTLPGEGGASLRGAGWCLIGQRGGGNWNTPSRPRADTPAALQQPKHLWAAA